MHPDVPIQRVPLVRPLRPRSDIQAFREVRAVLTQIQPALVHTHMAKAGFIGRLAATTLRSKPVVLHTFHGHVLEGYFRKTLQSGFLLAERRLAQRTDALIAVSQEVADELLHLGIGDSERMHVIPLGLDLSSMLSIHGRSGKLRQALRVGEYTALIGIAARLVPIKDHATLFRALQRLPEVHVAVLGDGQLRFPLAALADSLEIEDRVHFTGWWSDMGAAYSDLDLVVMSSRNEGTPVALIEAAAASVAVVSTDVGGVRSVVLEDESGLLVPPQDSDALATAIQVLLDDPDRRRHMGERGRTHVRERFSHERLLRDMARLYRGLLQDRIV